MRASTAAPQVTERSVAQARDAFARAAASRGRVERTYRVAGRPVRIAFAGAAPLPFIDGPLSHLATPAAEPDLALHVWEEEAPSAPWRVPSVEGSCHLRTARVAGLHDGVSGAVSVFDAEARVGWCAFPRGAPLPFFERATPLRFLLEAWARGRGLHLLHAGAVGDARGGVLLLGPGEAGKTTAALACLGSLLLAGDDYVLVDAGPAPFAHGLYATANASAAHLRAAFPRLAPPAGQEGKVAVPLHDRAPAVASAGFPIRALVLPRVRPDGGTSLRPVAARDAVLAGAPQVMADARRPAALAALAALARAVPSFALDLGPDLARVPVLVDALLGGRACASA